MYNLKILCLFFTRIFLLFVILSNVNGQAQTDELKVLLNNEKHTDSYVDKLNDLGRDYLRENPVGSYQASQRALEISQKTGYRAGESRALNNLGNINSIQGKHEVAIKKYLQALHIRDSLGDEKGSASTLNNISNVYEIRGSSDVALNYLLQSLAIREKIKDRQGLALGYHNLSNIYLVLLKFDSALYYSRKSITKIENNESLMSDAYNTLGQIYNGLEKGDSAEYYLEKALNIKLEIGDKSNLPYAIQSYVAFVLIKQKKYARAIQLVEAGLEIATEEKMIKPKYDLLRLMANIYELNGDFRNALLFLEVSQVLNDSMLNKSNIELITRLERQYEFDILMREQNIKDVEQKATEKAQNTIIYISIMMLLITFVFIIILYNQNKARKLVNTELNDLNKSILNQNRLILEQKDKIDIKNKLITDSINYASKIQNSILPSFDEFKKLFPKSFLIYLPRDIVSGDFYWYCQEGGYIFLAIGDGTGHGVPGAFMSIIGINLLKEVILKDKISDPGKILAEMDIQLVKSLHTESENDIRDGMDIVLLRFGPDNELVVSGAARPLWILSDSVLSIFKFDRHSLGGFIEAVKIFPETRIQLKKSDRIYVFSDGITDQLGGPKRRKITSTIFKKWLEESQVLSIQEQHDFIQNKYYQWKGNLRQIDDILLTGIEID